MSMGNMIRLVRPESWIKNTIVFAPVVFSMRVGEMQAWTRAGVAAIACTFASGFAYILNDIRDIEADRAHPSKRNRPLVSGQVSISVAAAEAVVFLALAVIMAWSLSTIALLVVLTFVALQVSYTFLLKQKALLDVIIIALGFVLRAGSGVVAIGAEISAWLFICIFTICLFMGFCKRYNEVVTMKDGREAKNHRATLMAYTPELLTHLITVSAGIAVISFLLYGLSESTIERFGSIYFVYTLPLVFYAVFRFAMVSMKGSYTDPMDVVLHDRPFQIVSLVWAVAAIGIIFWGRALNSWAGSLY
jgi:4-hydroxybenzoate polyprenyltransferase